MPRLKSPGLCALCGERASAAAMAAHLRRCAPAHDAVKGAAVPLHHLRVKGTYHPIFWLDLAVKSGGTLRQLDQSLRMFGSFGEDRSMNARISDALPPPGRPVRYEYDFGSTTHLTLRVTGTRHGVIGRPAVRLLARNEAPVWPCATCGGGEGFLPVVNSPRMGVCGYDGGG